MLSGMIVPRDTPAEKMQEMAAVHPRLVTHEYGMDTKGDRPLESRNEDGVKIFNLEVSVIRWHILPKVTVCAFAYNGQIPGPRIRVTQGDRVRMIVHSQLPESTTVHCHGLVLPNKMDGPAFITQDPIRTGDSYAYEFTADQVGTFSITAAIILIDSRMLGFTEPSLSIRGSRTTNGMPILSM